MADKKFLTQLNIGNVLYDIRDCETYTKAEIDDSEAVIIEKISDIEENSNKITIRRWEDTEMYIEGVFIETVSGKLISADEWNDCEHPNGDKRRILDKYDRELIANTIYVSDGHRRVRLGLEWCNDSNCSAQVATSADRWTGSKGNSDYVDDGSGDYYQNTNKCNWMEYDVANYRLMIGHYIDWQFNDGEIIDCLSYYDSWDWNGKDASETLAAHPEFYNKMPALQAVRTCYNAKGELGYLMGISEIQLVYGYVDEVTECLEACDGHPFDGVGSVWSVSCYNENAFWYLYTDVYGYLNYNIPYDYSFVRPAF